MPGKFRYSLQKVLDFRAKREENAKQELSEVKHALEVQQDTLDQLSARYGAAQKQMGDQLQAGRSRDVQMSNDYVSSLDEKVKAQRGRLALAKARLEAAQRAFVETSKERSIMEKHRDKERERWVSEEKRLEGINLDEMASTGFLKKRRLAAEEAAEEEEALLEAEMEANASATGSPWIDGLLQSARIAQEQRNGGKAP